MGYLFLIAAVVSDGIKGFAGKKVSGRLNGLPDALRVGFLRMVLCVAISFSVVLISGTEILLSKAVILISILSGVVTTLMILSWLMAVREGAFVFLDVCSASGVVLPVIVSHLLFKESVSAIQYAGIALLIAAVYLMSGHNKSLKGKPSIKLIMMLIVLMVACGASSLCSKMYTYYVPGGSVVIFNLLTFLTAAVVIGVIIPFVKAPINVPRINLWKITPYVVFMSATMFTYLYFITKATSMITPILMFPLYNGMLLIQSMIMSVALFEERITRRGIVGISLTIVSLIIINGIS